MTMSFVGTLMTPRIDAKIRSKMYKQKKSDFKDILRERFRSQIRARRLTLFEKMRSLDDSDTVHNTLSNFLRNEIQEFDIVKQKKHVNRQLSNQFELNEQQIDHDILLELMKEIERELLEEQYKWILEEYHRDEEEINFLVSESVTCPVCQHGILHKKNHIGPIACKNCDLRLYSSLNLDNLGLSLRQNVEEHSRICKGVVNFSVLNDGSENTLFMTCSQCSVLCSFN